ncbi:4-hydroxy-tetrahydrodipicolinate synthase [Fusibacter ferrireducens]|uniref:4-hydroxy-tetrahydrodipicolinate synthase n=1 Tax=Fusibacter ferrireducens TaxID=2785058 RepID=A0ABR9ZQS0_9FIRM|nr:4-hydroxy-tetrahydrodipicolinate synthase [Fusibacter ferrireducens]MBF4692812.1 4-hydroxy-tetrahydrodipicolinate synthase [Fusibacter ferrireducens]
MELFIGSGVAIVTPLNDHGIDFEALKGLIEWHILNNTDAIIVSGTTGEAATLSDEEKKSLYEFTVKTVAGRVPVIAGTGSNDTKKAIQLSVMAEKAGVQGLLVVSPYYNKGTAKGMIAHFEAIANAVSTPIIIYNVPSRTTVNLTPSTIKALSAHKNIVGIKEASADISQIAELASLLPEDFALYAGNDDHIVPILSLGGKGVISTVANILPKETHDLVKAYMSGDLKLAREIQFRINPLVRTLFIETNPIPVKTALNLMGMNAGLLRLPLTEMDEGHKEQLISILNAYHLL